MAIFLGEMFAVEKQNIKSFLVVTPTQRLRGVFFAYSTSYHF